MDHPVKCTGKPRRTRGTLRKFSRKDLRPSAPNEGLSFFKVLSSTVPAPKPPLLQRAVYSFSVFGVFSVFGLFGTSHGSFKPRVMLDEIVIITWESKTV